MKYMPLQRSVPVDCSVKVLIIEDNPADVAILKHAMRELRTPFCYSVIANGEDALLFLKEAFSLQNDEQPHFIILDAHLPKCDGIDVLKGSKDFSVRGSIPIVVLTGSIAPDLRHLARQNGAYECFQKPSDLAGWLELARRIERVALDLWPLGSSQINSFVARC